MQPTPSPAADSGHQHERLPGDAAPAADGIAERVDPLHGVPGAGVLISRSSLMTAAVAVAQRVSSLPVDVLLIGETGAGKDALAEHMHLLSGREGPFVAINCAGIPETLFESELFGTEAGAYTGATKSRQGLLERADAGTLYLDEIESMPLASQGKLLRVLQDRRVQRLGSTRSVDSRFRVIAAAKKALPHCIAEGRFRQDLYYRLSVVEIAVPPLRERCEDVIPLFKHFAELAANRYGMPPLELSLELLQQLLAYHWPGNVRELKSCAERAVLGLSILDSVSHQGQRPASLRELVDGFERQLIHDALQRARGSVLQASGMLMVPLPTLYYRMRKLRIEPGEHRTGSDESTN